MAHAHLVEMLEAQGAACGRLGSSLYEELLARIAEDVRAGGTCAGALAGYEDARSDDAVPLRLLGGVHALVLTGRAPRLAAHYPSAGGTFDPGRADALWEDFRGAVAANPDGVRDWMARPPQTNEVGRANLLLAGVLYAAARRPLPVRLLELGSSAGLNLLAEQFRVTAPGFSWGPRDSPVQLTRAWREPVPGWLATAAERHRALTVVERRGCDPDPVDPRSADGALVLRSYLWPDQTGRMGRLEGALRLASGTPLPVTRQGSADFLRDVNLQPGALTVVWHSVMRQYVPEAEWARAEQELARLTAAAGEEAAFAHLAFEPHPVDKGRFVLSVRVDAGPLEFLAEAHPHGLPAHGPAASDPPAPSAWHSGADPHVTG